MNSTLPIHEALKPLSWLVGSWIGSNGVGQFPTIKPFNYCEEISFLSFGQPLLNFTSQTWHAEKKNPMHFEAGFLRIKPDSNQVSFVVSHNFGVSEVEEGTVDENRLVLETISISRMSFAKDPAVTKPILEFSQGSL
ncbi:peroxynitrite isomerase THAP4-like isoform X3 [Macrosteles quadrilineatus]|uniref:peroxynitrite isomerase THAP4-like isoform X3 n=1 Tax=Macrosteles quadrilineatus TaxID=74068 RepID=UPI0023E247EA|nr:peroxynitrite isomerase THAP4-like isoform X3 [Macrosteles quadrilineatus]